LLRAYGSWVVKETKNPKVVIGRDARISGEMVSKLVTATLQGLGIHVVDLGLSTTPTVELAVPLEKAGGGIILTASHNPDPMERPQIAQFPRRIYFRRRKIHLG
jgi:phosphomannomutase